VFSSCLLIFVWDFLLIVLVTWLPKVVEITFKASQAFCSRSYCPKQIFIRILVPPSLQMDYTLSWGLQLQHEEYRWRWSFVPTGWLLRIRSWKKVGGMKKGFSILNKTLFFVKNYFQIRPIFRSSYRTTKESPDFYFRFKSRLICSDCECEIVYLIDVLFYKNVFYYNFALLKIIKTGVSNSNLIETPGSKDIQSNSVITNSPRPAEIVRYNWVYLWSKMTNWGWKICSL